LGTFIAQSIEESYPDYIELLSIGPTAFIDSSKNGSIGLKYTGQIDNVTICIVSIKVLLTYLPQFAIYCHLRGHGPFGPLNPPMIAYWVITEI
jgi:hypothetical protein